MGTAIRSAASFLRSSSCQLRRSSDAEQISPCNAFRILSFSTSRKTLVTPNISDLSEVVSYLRRESDPKNLRRFFIRSMKSPSFRQNEVPYRIAIRKLALENRQDAVQQILDKLVETSKPCTEEIAIRVMKLYGRAGMPNQAIQTFENLESLGISPTVNSFNALLTSLVRAQEHQRAIDFFSKAENFPVSPDFVSYNIYMNALCKTGDHRAAIDVLSVMKEKGIQPNIVSYITVIDSLYNNTKIEKEKRDELLDLMLSTSMSEEISYNCRLRRLCKDLHLDEARQLFNEMRTRSFSLDQSCLNSLVIALCKGKKVDEAKEIFDMYKDRRGHCGHSYNMLVRALVKEGHVDAATDLLHEMLQKEWLPDRLTVDAIAESLLNAGKAKTDRARSLVRRMRRSLPPIFLQKWDERLSIFA